MFTVVDLKFSGIFIQVKCFWCISMSDTTDSVAKGVFVFKNAFKRELKGRNIDPEQYEDYNPFTENIWYQQYIDVWNTLEGRINDISTKIFTSMTEDVMDFLSKSHSIPQREVPTAALLTGINMPDHASQFKTLELEIKKTISPHVACLNSQEGSNLKYVVENMISQFVQIGNSRLDSDPEEDEILNQPTIKRSSLCFGLLQTWYANVIKSGAKKSSNPLIVIVPDFESFNMKVLKRFILIVSSYIEDLPFVFVFGIATSLNSLQTAFPYHVIAKISIKVFKCEKSIEHLNRILEEVFLDPRCPVQFGPRVFNLFTDIFLFYDFSVNNFIQNIKYAIMEHYCFGNVMSLCTVYKSDAKKTLLSEFDHDDLENARQIMSFRKLVESENNENRIKLLTDDDHFKDELFKRIEIMQKYIRRLHIFLRCLHVFVADLPGAPLGKHVREIYPFVLRKNFALSPEFIECFKILSFQSKDELRRKANVAAEIVHGYLNKNSQKTELKEIHEKMLDWIKKLDNLDQLNANEEIESNDDQTSNFLDKQQLDRKSLKEALLNKAKYKPRLNKYEKLRSEILDFFKLTFSKYLVEPKSFYFHEIFFFDDTSIQGKIIGSHRSAIHHALCNPHYYLKCKCCEISNNSSIKSCMPDICVAYKLHLESGKMINLYDWLQAFLSILDPTDEEDGDSKKVVDPELQARFTQCVAELEHLGFIKSSKRKLDHVARLTWGE